MASGLSEVHFKDLLDHALITGFNPSNGTYKPRSDGPLEESQKNYPTRTSCTAYCVLNTARSSETWLRGGAIEPNTVGRKKCVWHSVSTAPSNSQHGQYSQLVRRLEIGQFQRG